MGDKGKGKNPGSAKKPKTAKAGQRPHEVRQREGLQPIPKKVAP
jgi:hypothetical protein